MIGIFWGSVLSVFYVYLGYPLLLMVFSKIFRKTIKHADGYTPLVTLITTAYNEANQIEKKISNILELNYPSECLEIIIASDASTDMTDNIIQAYSNQGIKLVRSSHRGGKEFAQKCAIKQAHGEILVFTDVSTILEKDGINNITKNFADPTVGCVSSVDKFIDKQGGKGGEGTYIRYEMCLRTLETRFNSVICLSGSFFAARKEICENLSTGIPSDFSTLLNSIKLGYRGISDQNSIGIYSNIKDERKEFDRKVRTVTGGLAALFANKTLLNPFAYGMFSWQLLSHKLMRWLVPWFLISAIVANVILFSRKALYKILIVPQILFYFLSLVGYVSSYNSLLLKVPYYFVQVNFAILYAWVKYLSGERFITWTPSNR
jgi:cellulose synthase/poly-beta-1,6-N-acetylglucosamine synthase-like glycosyltransferase